MVGSKNLSFFGLTRFARRLSELIRELTFFFVLSKGCHFEFRPKYSKHTVLFKRFYNTQKVKNLKYVILFFIFNRDLRLSISLLISLPPNLFQFKPSPNHSFFPNRQSPSASPLASPIVKRGSTTTPTNPDVQQFQVFFFLLVWFCKFNWNVMKFKVFFSSL